jgi:hypothetical protein
MLVRDDKSLPDAMTPPFHLVEMVMEKIAYMLK